MSGGCGRSGGGIEKIIAGEKNVCEEGEDCCRVIIVAFILILFFVFDFLF